MPQPMNGTADLPVPAPLSGRRRLHAVPQTREYEIERGGEVVVLNGYIQGPSCPISVAIEVQAAEDDYVMATGSLLQAIKLPDGTTQQRLRPGTRTVDLTAPAMRRRQAMLCAVIRGLAEEEANVLAADGGEWEPILVELGWWKPAEAEEDEADPEATGELPTSAGSSPASVSTTPEPTS